MLAEQGKVSISSENMFPIIKKWLYSDKDIFMRELVSNCSDAITKHATLSDTEEPYRINVTVDSEKNTITFDDNGIGMTEDEVKRYINQVAYSGAKDFFEKYKDKGESAQIIGHFGLGFYSSFMAAKRVTIDTLSYIDGSEAVRWTSEDGVEYEMSASDKTTRGTVITLELDDESKEFADKWKAREILTKYFRYLPTPIFIKNVSDEPAKDDSAINPDAPLWMKSPKDCTDEEYKEFYRKNFFDGSDPLFWVHLNIDYPFRLQGILYFPKISHELSAVEGQVKLYCNRVYVADNIKEIIPEYLLLLKGMIDCPDLPLNVSRSFLQNDSTVEKLSNHITKKVSDRLTSMFNDERPVYEGYWDDISPFVKYGCLRDEKFYDRVKAAILFKTVEGKYKTLEEYSSDEKKTVWYVSDPNTQAQYVSMFKANNIDAVILDHMLDSHFISFLEYKVTDLKFKRIDSDMSGVTDGASENTEDFNGVLDLMKDIAPDVKIEEKKFLAGAAPAVMVLSEEGRRIQEMSRMWKNNDFAGQFKEEYTLYINTAHPLINALKNKLGTEEAKTIAEQVYDLARLAQKPLEADEMTKFIERSAKIMLYSLPSQQ